MLDPSRQISKSYFYTYATKFSKGQDKKSPLTKDIETQLNIYFPAMTAVEKLAKAGDQSGAEGEFAKAEEALNAIVDVLEAETRGGRINSIKVSLKALTGEGDASGLNVYQENMKEMRRRAKEGVDGPGGAPAKKFL